jgi:hypothetical protein
LAAALFLKEGASETSLPVAAGLNAAPN